MIKEVRTKAVYWPPSWTPEKQSAEIEYETNAFITKLNNEGRYRVEGLDVIPMTDSGYTSGIVLVAKISRL